MSPERKEFLNLRDKPARLTVEEAAIYLGFSANDIPILVARGLLDPLGNPPPNGVKYFAAAELTELKADRRWLARATDAIHRYWKEKNAQRKNNFMGANKSAN